MKSTISVTLDDTTMLKFKKKMEMIGMSEKDAIRLIAKNGSLVCRDQKGSAHGVKRRR